MENNNMKTSLKHIESEIVNQILISELCFNICKSIKREPGRGNDFIPYYYNLNFIKGIISLHSLLDSEKKDELSIKNYIKRYKLDFPSDNIKELEKNINSISKSFKNIFKISLRHKIGAHISESFTHMHFTSAYIIPSLVPKYIKIIKGLKIVFFNFSNRSKTDYPFEKITKQSDSIIKNLYKDIRK